MANPGLSVERVHQLLSKVDISPETVREAAKKKDALKLGRIEQALKAEAERIKNEKAAVKEAGVTVGPLTTQEFNRIIMDLGLLSCLVMKSLSLKDDEIDWL